jgi:hypothetical protein
LRGAIDEPVEAIIGGDGDGVGKVTAFDGSGDDIQEIMKTTSRISARRLQKKNGETKIKQRQQRIGGLAASCRPDDANKGFRSGDSLNK